MPNNEDPKFHTLLFCPFCKEEFEDEAYCPAHDLKLVPLHKLPKTDRPPSSEEKLSVFDPRFGRAALFLSAVLLMLGFLMPFMSASQDETITETAFEMALTRTFNLWMIPTVSTFYFWILFQRRTLKQMRGAKVSILFLALLTLASLLFTLWRVHAANQAMGNQIDIQLTTGFWTLLVGFVLAIFSSFTFGAIKPPKHKRVTSK